MNRLVLTVAMTTLLVPSFLLRAEDVAATRAAAKTQLTGTWTLVLVYNVTPDGKKTHPYGENPHGLLMFDAQGRYALQILGSERPRFAANDKTKGTPAEYAATVQGSNSHFGHYAVNDADGTVTFKIEHASYPNWEGSEQKRVFTLEDGVLTYRVPTTTNGVGVTGEVQWRKME